MSWQPKKLENYTNSSSLTYLPASLMAFLNSSSKTVPEFFSTPFRG
jgi:hypothetical protein